MHTKINQWLFTLNQLATLALRLSMLAQVHGIALALDQLIQR